MAKWLSAFLLIRFSSSRAATTTDIPVRKKQTKNSAGARASIFYFVRQPTRFINRSLDIRGRDSLSSTLEGKSRPGHFRGVCTVVAKLFNILAPDAAVFGEKDFQQLAVIRRMVRDLNFKIDIIAVPTVREEDGLACSSRNQYLNPEERKQAAVLHKALMAAKNAGKKSANDVVALTQRIINEAHLARIDYVEVADAETLKPIETAGPNCVLLLAVSFGKTRLIDNMRLAA